MSHLNFLLGVLIFLLISCGNNNNGNSQALAPVENQTEEQLDEGLYRAILIPQNESIAGETLGSVEIRITGDEVVVQTAVSGAQSGVKHLQHVHNGSSCPNLERIQETMILPPSVQFLGGETAHSSLPIACGVLTRINFEGEI